MGYFGYANLGSLKSKTIFRKGKNMVPYFQCFVSFVMGVGMVLYSGIKALDLKRKPVIFFIYFSIGTALLVSDFYLMR